VQGWLAEGVPEDGNTFVRVCCLAEPAPGKAAQGFVSEALDRRPQLRAALSEARKPKCSVAVAKLDRLSRDVHFISGLMARPSRQARQNRSMI
jgi:hypothetical protein